MPIDVNVTLAQLSEALSLLAYMPDIPRDESCEYAPVNQWLDRRDALLNGLKDDPPHPSTTPEAQAKLAMLKHGPGGLNAQARASGVDIRNCKFWELIEEDPDEA